MLTHYSLTLVYVLFTLFTSVSRPACAVVNTHQTFTFRTIQAWPGEARIYLGLAPEKNMDEVNFHIY